MPDDPVTAKALLRRTLRRSRRMLSDADRLAQTAGTVATCRAWLAARAQSPVASYAACGGELDLADLHRWLWQHGRTLLLPRIAGPGQLSWHVIPGPDRLCAGPHGISEPDPTRDRAVELPRDLLVLVPGVGFSADGHRLGQGFGYYDRMLARRPGPAVGVGFACQLLPQMPYQDHDVPLEGLIIAGSWVRALSGPMDARP